MGDGPSSAYLPGYTVRGGLVIWYCHRDAQSLIPPRPSTAQYVLPESIEWGEIRVSVRHPRLPKGPKQ